MIRRLSQADLDIPYSTMLATLRGTPKRSQKESWNKLHLVIILFYCCFFIDSYSVLLLFHRFICSPDNKAAVNRIAIDVCRRSENSWQRDVEDGTIQKMKRSNLKKKKKT